MAATALFVAGVVSWTLFEYLVHRYLYHLISESRAARRFAYTLHGIHHEFPRDEERLFLPPVPAALAAAILFGVFYLALGPWTYLYFAGFVTAYTFYAFLHFCIHRYHPPRMLKFLWHHHLQHHYKRPDLAYGVSSPLWDVIFRTMPPREKVRSRMPETSRSAVRN